MKEELNYEIQLIDFDGQLSDTFEFHGDNLELARDHAECLLKEANTGTMGLSPIVKWEKPAVGPFKGRFRSFRGTRWRAL